MAPTRGERAAAATWALPTFRLQLFSYLDGKTLATALRISRGSFEEAVRVIYREVIHTDILHMLDEGVDLVRHIKHHQRSSAHVYARRLLYIGSIIHINDCGTYPFLNWHEDHLHLAQDFLAKYPNLRSFGAGQSEYPALQVERSGSRIMETTILKQVDIHSPQDALLPSIPSWRLSPWLSLASEILDVKSDSFCVNIIKAWANRQGVFQSNVHRANFVNPPMHPDCCTDLLEQRGFGRSTHILSVRVAWTKSTRRASIARLLQAADGKVDQLSINHTSDEPDPPTWINMLLAVADADLREIRELELWTDGLSAKKDQELVDQADDGSIIRRNMYFTAPKVSNIPFCRWTDSPTRHHLRSLTIHIYIHLELAAHLFSYITDLSHALLEAGGSTCIFRVIIENKNKWGAWEEEAGREVFQTMLDHMLKVEMGRIIEKRREGRLPGWRRRSPDGGPKEEDESWDLLAQETQTD